MASLSMCSGKNTTPQPFSLLFPCIAPESLCSFFLFLLCHWVKFYQMWIGSSLSQFDLVETIESSVLNLSQNCFSKRQLSMSMVGNYSSFFFIAVGYYNKLMEIQYGLCSLYCSILIFQTDRLLFKKSLDWLLKNI